MGKSLDVLHHVLKNGYEYETSPFGPRKDPISGYDSYHNGEDMISSRYGTDTVVAFQDGVVSAVRNSVSGFDKSKASGNYIYIDHAGGYQTRYLHLKKDSLKVSVGQEVKKGDGIAYMGSTGYSTGNHVHFEVRLNSTPQDPIPYLSGDHVIPPAASSAGAHPEVDEPDFEIGDIVDFIGEFHYSNAQATAATGGKRTAGKAKVTGIAKGRLHPYHLIGIKGGSNVYGWVDASTIAGDAPKEEPVSSKNEIFRKGDTVKIKADARWYNNKTIPSWVKEDIWIVYQDQLGDRVVINSNTSGRNAIMSPVHADDLIRI